jgi:hypothetical protein
MSAVNTFIHVLFGLENEDVVWLEVKVRDFLVVAHLETLEKVLGKFLD